MPARIVVIEDHPPSLELIVYLLRNAGYPTQSAMDGEAGLELVRREKPDLVLCDLQIPNIDGYEVARQLKADQVLQKIPLLAVSAFSMTGDRDRGLAAGFDAYYAKPIEPELFVAQIEQHLPPALRAGSQ
jgi:CheY-like chemotaxis protein